VRASELLERQLGEVNQILHDVASDLTPEEATARVLPRTVALADVLEYADATHHEVLAWLRALPDDALRPSRTCLRIWHATPSI
jgi:hypothetical protein